MFHFQQKYGNLIENKSKFIFKMFSLSILKNCWLKNVNCIRILQNKGLNSDFGTPFSDLEFWDIFFWKNLPAHKNI